MADIETGYQFEFLHIVQKLWNKFDFHASLEKMILLQLNPVSFLIGEKIKLMYQLKHFKS